MTQAPIRRKAGFTSDMDNIQPLNPDIQDRAETILDPSYETTETGADLTEKAIGMLEGPAMLLADPMALIQKYLFSGKQDRIDQLSTDTTNTYRASDNSYSKAGSVLDGMRNIKSDDITKRKEEQLRNKVRSTKDYSLFEEGVKSGLVSKDDTRVIDPRKVTKGAQTQFNNTDLMEQISKVPAYDGNPSGLQLLEEYKKLGKTPSNAELTSLLKRIEPQTDAGRTRTATRENLEGETTNAAQTTQNDTDRVTALQDQNRITEELNNSTIAIKGDELDIKRTEIDNRQLMDRYALDVEQGKLDHATQQLNARLAHESGESNKRNELEMAIAMMNREDRQGDRQYDRERDERQDKQMMIMQLMKGLSNLGSSFAL